MPYAFAGHRVRDLPELVLAVIRNILNLGGRKKRFSIILLIHTYVAFYNAGHPGCPEQKISLLKESVRSIPCTLLLLPITRKFFLSFLQLKLQREKNVWNDKLPNLQGSGGLLPYINRFFTSSRITKGHCDKLKFFSLFSSFLSIFCMRWGTVCNTGCRWSTRTHSSTRKMHAERVPCYIFLPRLIR